MGKFPLLPSQAPLAAAARRETRRSGCVPASLHRPLLWLCDFFPSGKRSERERKGPFSTRRGSEIGTNRTGRWARSPAASVEALGALPACARLPSLLRSVSLLGAAASELGNKPGLGLQGQAEPGGITKEQATGWSGRCGQRRGPGPGPVPGAAVAPRSPHGHWETPLTPVKLDPSGVREAPSGQSPPTCHPHPWDTPAASWPPAGQGPDGVAVGSYQDATTITELCSGGSVPEVELVSLLGEQLPCYTLRADTLFGYEHDDWLCTPLAPPEAPAPLTPQQMEETLKYFLLCSERVGRITKTYCDLDAVTNLLDEKERDLELAARIGQSLLKQNRSLAEHNELLEEQLELAKEEIAQLRHEVSMQDDLLHFYTNTVEDSEPATATATPLRQNDSLLSLQQYVQYDALQQKLKQLEEENEKLRLEATSITTETCQYEDQEQQLMLDCVEQFSEASRQVAALSEELARKAEDSLRQQEEISHLLAQIVDLQQKCRRHSTEVEELQQHLTVAKEAEQKLCTELQDLQERYTECCGMLQEAQEEIRNLRNRSLPNSTVHRYGLPSLVPLDSLAAELKGITRKGADSTSSDYKSYLRVFETVKVVNQAAKAKSRAESPQNLPSSKLPSAGPSAACSRVSTPRTSYYGSDSASLGLETLESASSGGEEKQRGAPGTPGRHDLEAALQRLSACQASHQAEGSFFETEREAKLSRLAGDAESSSGFLTPNESLLSTGTNYSGSSGHSGGSSFSLSSLPDKLRIIKPLEGSVTLHHWQQLAKPNLGGILDPRPGVLTKDFRQLDVDLEEVYNLHDLEEDDVDLSAVQALATSTPSKAKGCSSVLQSINNLPQTPSTFTITTCHMLHPSQEITTVTPSLYNTVVPSCGPFEWLSAPSPLRQMPEPAPEPPLRLIPLLQKQGISASVQAGSPGREQGDSLWHRLLGGLAQPFPGVPRLQEGGSIGSQPQSNIFSLNLVEKLKRLRLDKVVARGAASFQSAGEGPGPAALPVRTPRP